MHIQKRQGTYRITVSCGRDESGKQMMNQESKYYAQLLLLRLRD